MKRNLVWLGLIICLGGLFVSETAVAIEKFDSTSLNISFASQEPTPPKPPMIEEPEIPAQNPSRVGKLPSTGDLINSLIYTIIGCSFLLVVVGVLCLRNIMSRMAWE